MASLRTGARLHRAQTATALLILLIAPHEGHVQVPAGKKAFSPATSRESCSNRRTGRGEWAVEAGPEIWTRELAELLVDCRAIGVGRIQRCSEEVELLGVQELLLTLGDGLVSSSAAARGAAPAKRRSLGAVLVV